MEPIYYIDRETKTKKEEKIYGFRFLYLLYGQYPMSSFFSGILKHMAKFPFLSKVYGSLQRLSVTKRKIKPFIKTFHLDSSEFEKKPDQFTSFNDFFIRKLKKESRPIDPHPGSAIIPADGRYMFFPNISETNGFYVKGAEFCLKTFLNSDELAKRYENGTMMIARLCPTDYHRYHFPCNCIPQQPKLINGYLHSVNLASLKRNIHIFSENKRYLTILNTEKFGQVIYSEVGATCVGSIIHNFKPDQWQPKGAEKGYFSFGASSIIMLFEQGRITLEKDLIAFRPFTEIKCRFGQVLGTMS